MRQTQEHVPDYPPRTPPPQRKPVSPPPPQPDTKPAGLAPARPRVVMANRRVANWTLEGHERAIPAARRRVADQLQQWGCRPAEDSVGPLVALMFRTAVEDGGSRVSVHLADQGDQAMILVLSHLPSQERPGLFQDMVAAGARDCGTDTDADGRRLWAAVNLTR